jgi:DNA-binding NarL/FixJ family response regulator
LADARREADAQGARPLRWRIEAEQARLHRLRREHAQARRTIEVGRVIAAELAALIGDAELRRAFERAVDDALPPARAPSARQLTKAKFDGLTRREVEVARLVAAGKSNRAIARALQVGERTVESHVAGALAKLGFSSRSRLAVWAVERGLGRVSP